MTKNKTNQAALFDELVNNAFDFLERAIDQFSREPKYSVINFCAAIELLLKARLMHEHWSLVVATKNHPSISDFKSGNFKSINFKDLIPRIVSVTGDKISDDTLRCFNNLADHRNKMIHFFHEAHSDAAQEKIKETIAIEQCSGWFFLRRLFEKWDFIFSRYTEKITAINLSMKAHEVYLDTVYDRIKPEIEAARKKGSKFINCPMCKKEASEEFQRTDYIFEYKCRVCLFPHELIKIKCPGKNCKHEVEIESGDPDQKIVCDTCDEEISRKEISDILDTEHFDYGDHRSINCAACGGMDAVIQHHDFFICTDCFYITQEMGVCGWCSEGQIAGGDLEYSYHGGCEFCDGHAGWTKDD